MTRRAEALGYGNEARLHGQELSDINSTITVFLKNGKIAVLAAFPIRFERL
jgi:hypothetical protein